MTLFSKFTKNSSGHNNEKAVYPWSQRKLSGSKEALTRFGHGSTMLDNQHFVVFGGVHSSKGNAKKSLFMIDINNVSASSISTSGDIPSSRSFTTIASMGGFILLYGGEPIIPGEIWDPYFYVLHTNTRQWSRVRTKGNLPSERAGHSICIADDGIMYIWGGHYQRKYLNDLCAFNVKEYPSKAEWEFIEYENQGPTPRSGHVSVIYDNKLYIFGGINASHLYNDIWYFDLVTRIWHQIAAVGYIPAPRESCAAALVDDTIYIFGGKGLNGCGLGDLCAYRIKSQRWYMFQNMGAPPSPRFGATLTVIQNKIYVFGGESISGKTEDTSYVYILDCAKIKYPPEPEPSESETSNLDRATSATMNNINSRMIKNSELHHINNNDVVEDLTTSKLNTHSSPRINTRQLPPNMSSPIHRPLPPQPSHLAEEQEEEKLNSPVAAHNMESNSSYNRQHIGHQPAATTASVPPPRPPREGATLGDAYRQQAQNMDPALKFRRESVQHSSRGLRHAPLTNFVQIPEQQQQHQQQHQQEPKRQSQLDHEEKKSLMREIIARDVIISEMKKKEQWWRTEVSIARHVRSGQREILEEDDETKDALLIQFDEENDEISNEKMILFKQLVDVKTEIKKIRGSINKQAEPLSQKMEQAERVRTIALEEAAYYKAKYAALKSNNTETLDMLESERVQVLEERLKAAYEEKARNEKSIQQIQIQSQHDKASRLHAEERAKEAQLQSEEAQVAHQEALERLSKLYQQIVKAEAKGRQDAIRIAELSNQVAHHLALDKEQENSDSSHLHLEMGRLEAANIKNRNEIAQLLKKLEESRDEEMNLKILLNERDQAYAEAVLELEKTCIELELFKNAASSSASASTNTTVNNNHRNSIVDVSTFV